MLSHILIPDFSMMKLATLLLMMGAFTLAQQLQARFQVSLNFFQWHAVVLTGIALVACLQLNEVVAWEWPATLWLLIAVIFASVQFSVDKKIIRFWRSRQRVYRVMPTRWFGFGIGIAIFIALVEEYLFRGVLWGLAQHFPLKEQFFMAVGITIIFALNHIDLGLAQMFCKFLLATGLLLLVIVSHSLISAMIAHSTFNILVWRQYHHAFIT